MIARWNGGGIIDGNVLVRDVGENFYQYDGLIDTVDESAVKTLSVKRSLLGGDYNQIISAGGYIYAANYNSSNVAIYKGQITEDNVNASIAYLGGNANMGSMTVERGIFQNPVTATDGKSLVVGDDFNRVLAIYKDIPSTDNAKADYLYGFESSFEYPIDVDIDEDGKLYVLTRKSVFVWNKVPLLGETYDKRYSFGVDYEIGQINAKFALDYKYFYIASEPDRCVYVFDKTATSFEFSKAIKKIDTGVLRNISSNGSYLLATSQSDACVNIYKTSDFNLYGVIKGIGQVAKERMNLPSGAIFMPDGQLVIADSGNNRVLVYANIEKAIANFTSYTAKLGTVGQYTVETSNGGPVKMTDIVGISGKNSTFTPSSLMFYGGHLWVGEFKFSSRILRYDMH